MKTLLITTGLISLLALSSPAVFAGKKYNNNSFEDTARVTHVEPIYTTVRVATPQRECSSHASPRDSSQHNSYTKTIAGSLLGGVLGNQFGGGSGKKIMTVAGALLGGSIGRDFNNQSSYSRYNTRETCQITERYHQEERVDGYYVSYRYQGKTYTTEMDTHPGKRIPIEVSVRPRHSYY